MLPDRVSNPGPLTYETDALPIALRGPASEHATSVQRLSNVSKRHGQRLVDVVLTSWSFR